MKITSDKVLAIPKNEITSGGGGGGGGRDSITVENMNLRLLTPKEESKNRKSTIIYPSYDTIADKDGIFPKIKSDSINNTKSPHNQQATTLSLENNTSTKNNKNSKPTIKFPLAASKATKILKREIKQLPPDLNVHKLIEIELFNRKINVGDRDLLERGLRHEYVNELDQAIACYTRARKQSKDPYLPRLFLGAVYFKQELYLTSLKHFSAAVQMISELNGALYSIQDDFCANFNRAATYFRVGDDKLGEHIEYND